MSAWGRCLAWMSIGRRAQRERDLLEGQLRELRIATATLRAQVSVMQLEVEQAMALAAERRAQAARLTLLLPLIHNAFAAAAAEARERIHLDYSPDVALLVPAKRREVIDLEPRTAATPGIVLPVHTAAAS